MALPVLDGNQSATTLSSVVTGGEHIVAHSVVSLGANAISDITSAVSGSVVSISNFPASQIVAGTVTASNIQNIFGTTEIYVTDYNTDTKFSSANPFPISGTVTAQGPGPDSSVYVSLSPDSSSIGPLSQILSDSGVLISSLPAISGTVTANNPNGALTTRFGSVTTANTAELTSAVTNSSRKYLLVQNIASDTVTIGIGFAPTTTQGIQLSAGGGLTFDAFTPTGAIYWLSGVTGSNWSILEG